MNTQYKWLLILLVFGFVACESDDEAPATEEEVAITSGTADFSRYVALGNSLTAGFTDGALFIAGQEDSYPNILAQQFALAGGGEFKQPLMNDNIGGLLLGGSQLPGFGPRLYFYRDPDPAPPSFSGPTPLGVVPPTDIEAEMPTTDITVPLTGSFNNMGIPGAQSFHLLANGYGNIAGLQMMPPMANPYFVRIASNPNASVLEDAMKQDPTFFSLWIGSNDVLGYALSGGDGTSPIIDTSIFTQSYNTLVETLTSGGAKGVIFNIPDVTAIAHFTTVPHNPLDPDNPSFGPLIPTLNAQFAGLNQVFNALGVSERMITFKTEKDSTSAVIIKDESLVDLSIEIRDALIGNMVDAGTATVTGILYGQARQATKDDLFVLPSSAIIGQVNTAAITMLTGLGLSEAQAGQLAVNGITYPLEDKWVLTPEEQEEIATATSAYNAVIDAAVQQKGLAFVDANGFLDQVSSDDGLQFDEFTIQGNIVFGGLFSLDGVHPTARGAAFLANKAAEAINTTYGSNLPTVKAADYPTFYSGSLK